MPSRAQRRVMTVFLVTVVLVLLTGCKPKDQEMLVVYVQGDVFRPSLSPAPWGEGESQQCRIASRGSPAPDKRGHGATPAARRMDNPGRSQAGLGPSEKNPEGTRKQSRGRAR